MTLVYDQKLYDIYISMIKQFWTNDLLRQNKERYFLFQYLKYLFVCVDTSWPNSPCDNHKAKDCRWCRSLEDCGLRDVWLGRGGEVSLDGCHPVWNCIFCMATGQASKIHNVLFRHSKKCLKRTFCMVLAWELLSRD